MTVETIVAEAVVSAVEPIVQPLIDEAVHEVVVKLTAKEADYLKELFDIAGSVEEWLKKEITGFIENMKAKF